MRNKCLRVCQLCAVDFTLKNFLLPLIDGMQKRGWEVTAVSSDGPYIDGLIKRGYQIEKIHIARSMNPYAAFRSLLRLILLFRHKHFDVLHAHTPVAGLIGRLAGWLTRVPIVVYTAHGFYFHEDMPAKKYRIFVMLERMAGWWTDLLFTQSLEDAKTAALEKIMPQNRIVAIGNGVDVTRFSPDKVDSGNEARKSLGIPDNAYVIGFIGRLVKEKGVADFLCAAKMLSQTFPQVWFLLIGERLSSDHADGVVTEFVQANKVIGERLIAPGLRTDIPEMLSAMDLFCLPSWREGMPRTIIEAMMMAKPIVATNIRGSREEVVNEETGLLVPVRSPELLASAIGRFVANPKWGRALGNAGRDRALSLYDERTVVSMQLEQIEIEVRRRETML
jgi:glycosyltransferase involved in cell wall biosynthesis